MALPGPSAAPGDITPSQHRFGWGVNAVRAFAADTAVLVIVDVLSFSTTVDVAVSRGATIIPYRLDAGPAAAYGADHDAVPAVNRGNETADRPFSLSPHSMTAAGPDDRIVLPSPNGATLCVEAAGGDVAVIVGCLRNASAVASAVAADGPVAVVAAGERWPDGSLRPALEDLLGAGAVLAAMPPTEPQAPEAAVAVAAFRGIEADLAAVLAGSVSGRELRQRGYPDDVAVAAAHDVSATVPTVRDGATISIDAAPDGWRASR